MTKGIQASLSLLAVKTCLHEQSMPSLLRSLLGKAERARGGRAKKDKTGEASTVGEKKVKGNGKMEGKTKGEDTFSQYINSVAKVKFPHCKSLFDAKGTIFGRPNRGLHDWFKLHMQASTCSTWMSVLTRKFINSVENKREQLSRAKNCQNRMLNFGTAKDSVKQVVLTNGKVSWNCKLLGFGSKLGFVCSSGDSAKEGNRSQQRKAPQKSSESQSPLKACTIKQALNTLGKAIDANQKEGLLALTTVEKELQKIRQNGSTLGDGSDSGEETTICKSLLFDSEQQPWANIYRRGEICPRWCGQKHCPEERRLLGILTKQCEGMPVPKAKFCGWSPFKDSTLVMLQFPLMKQVHCSDGTCTVQKDISCSRQTPKVAASLFGSPFIDVNVRLKPRPFECKTKGKTQGKQDQNHVGESKKETQKSTRKGKSKGTRKAKSKGTCETPKRAKTEHPGCQKSEEIVSLIKHF